MELMAMISRRMGMAMETAGLDPGIGSVQLERGSEEAGGGAD
jgi:hypothetical protein